MDVVNFIVQLCKVQTLKDGGGRISFDYGVDSIKQINQIIEWNGIGETNLAIALSPVQASEPTSRIDDYNIDLDRI